MEALGRGGPDGRRRCGSSPGSSASRSTGRTCRVTGHSDREGTAPRRFLQAHDGQAGRCSPWSGPSRRTASPARHPAGYQCPRDAARLAGRRPDRLGRHGRRAPRSRRPATSRRAFPRTDLLCRHVAGRRLDARDAVRGRLGRDRVMTGPALDAIVVGSGPNGLAAALTLARAGRSVRVSRPRRDRWRDATEELTLPGFRHDVCSSIVPLTLASPFFRTLDLGGPWRRAHPPRRAGRAPAGRRPRGGSRAFVHRDGRRARPRPAHRRRSAWRRLFGPLARDADKLAESCCARSSTSRATRSRSPGSGSRRCARRDGWRCSRFRRRRRTGAVRRVGGPLGGRRSTAR